MSRTKFPSSRSDRRPRLSKETDVWWHAQPRSEAPIRRHAIKIAVGLIVTIGLLALALRGIPLADVTSSFRDANYLTIPIMLLMLFAFFWLKAIRWRLLLSPLGTFKTRDIFPPLLIGFMGNNVLPFHLGEFVRVYVFGREHQVSKTAVFSTVVLERIADIVAILVLFGIGLLSATELPDSYRLFSLVAAGVTLAGIAVLIVYIVWTPQFVRVAEVLLVRVPFLPSSISEKLCKMLELGAAGFGSLRSRSLIFWICVTSILQWLMNAGMVIVAVWSFGVSLPISAGFVVLGVTAIGVTIPSAPGFFGVIQYCFRISLVPFGVLEADAVAASVYYHMFHYIPITILGLYFLYRRGLSLGELRRAAEYDGTSEIAATNEIDSPG